MDGNQHYNENENLRFLVVLKKEPPERSVRPSWMRIDVNSSKIAVSVTCKGRGFSSRHILDKTFLQGNSALKNAEVNFKSIGTTVPRAKLGLNVSAERRETMLEQGCSR